MYYPNIRQFSFGVIKRYISILFIFLLNLIAVSGYSQISFAPYQAYATGSYPQVVCVGDVNNDGLNDVVLGTGTYSDPTNDYKIFVYLQNSSGSLNAPIKYSYPNTYPGISSISIADVDNNGLNDVIIGYGYSVGVFFQNSNGTLNAITNYYSGDNINKVDGITTGDLNNDGLTDIAVSHWGGTVISVLYQNSSGDFTTQNYAAPSEVFGQIEVGDVNNDKLNDVVLMLGQSSGGIHVFTQNGSGSLNSYVSYASGQGWYMGGIAIGDINNDGANDVVKTIYSNSPDSKIALFNQDTTSNLLLSPLLISAYDCPEPVRIADLNCDGRNEIIVAHGGWQRISVFEQDNNNLYNAYSLFTTPYASHYKPQGFCVGDINNDWKKDVVIADYNHGLVVLMNQSINYGLCCLLPAKPMPPEGDNTICSDDITSVYTTSTPLTIDATWDLFPAESGNIIFSDSDSCQISWNNTWRGVCGICILSTNICGTTSSDTLFVTINRIPSINLGNDTTLCLNNTLELIPGGDYESYLWQDNSTNSTFLVNTGGIYNVQTENICGIVYDTILVTDVSLPQIDLKDTTLCTDTNIQLDITKPEFSSYLWQDNSTSPVYTISNPGTYSVIVTDINNCKNNKSFYVNELSSPLISLPNDTTICFGENLFLNVSFEEASYLWQDGSILPQYEIETEGIYTVSITNRCGTITNSINVIVQNCNVYLDVPSAFSPNNDGLNDILYAVGTNVENIHFIIFNRWGQKVFESNNLEQGWDGTFEGQNLNTAVFVYTISATSTKDGHLINKSGNISLIK